MVKSFVLRADRRTRAAKGFTLIELLVGSAVMLIAILAALELYSRSNKVAVDQQQYADIQHDVRTSMYLISRDVRMAGSGLPQEFAMYSLEGTDNEVQGAEEVTPDRLTIMGNIEDPLNLKIQSLSGSSATVAFEDYSFEQYPYLTAYYDNKFILILPDPASACRAADVRIVTSVIHSAPGTNEKFVFSPGQAPGVDPPGGLSGMCVDESNYVGGSVMFIDVIEYWLDLTGNASDFGLTAGVNGYIGGGVGGVLYLTRNGVHNALAQNIENLQFEYNGDLDDDGTMDGFRGWEKAQNGVTSQIWDLDMVSRIRQVRIWVLGRTANRVLNVSGRPTGGIHIYRRPVVSNTPAMTADDRRKRFLMNSTANVRNLSLNIYNLGVR
ncbi:MAG TPA: PilW family protein [Acidobacteriota bacterium]|nr:PilW family protein [Acidobacteriota bacterium]